ncbi:thymidine phosphorylase [Jeotgalibacillus soli]|uniref:Pyrimidine-nucleoside phosphorylase n=1 Tax=Jeotgalibacillus soli TaxID=889306 RepID=A0A0C2VJT8_9BACL|nr:thymidine phosphorylase [Jeotgalibacillus soli]KIL44263.1 pyrimidine-nucleoside phosphorylase [Jeotgalibacillus soli]
MKIIDLINKKKRSAELTKEEIEFFIDGFVKGQIPDYQASAFLMSIWFNGMNNKETSLLTNAMVSSGDTMDLSFIKGKTVDKHSTGGVGDKLSLTVSPIIASLGISLAKMSGRGLGHTGGTIDKLEAIEGLNTELTKEQFNKTIQETGMVIAGQTANLVPADKKLYALRDVTGTVDSIPLIASSIMSKKIASGANSIVLDVKVGSGAFMKTIDEARELASVMVSIGESLGRKTIAVLSNMDQPIGRYVGNRLEVLEAYELLSGEYEEDLYELTVEISKQLLISTGDFTEDQAVKAIEESLASGKALQTFKRFLEAQGGKVDSIFNEKHKFKIAVKSPRDGYISKIDSEEVGMASLMLGAGRENKDSVINHATGVEIHKKIGNKVSAGDTLFTLYTDTENINEISDRLLNATVINEERVEKTNSILEVVK